MFLLKYLNDIEYDLLLNKYDEEIISSINENNFEINYRYLVSKKIFFVNDLVLKYLEIFSLDNSVIVKTVGLMEEKYGKDYRFYVGNNISLFNDCLLEEMER
jgi:hypothetical protein